MSQQLFKAYWQSLKFTLKDIPSANYYHRFHKRDINRIITIPCPNLEEAPIFKSLRANIGVKEDYVCPQCPHQKNCEISFKQPEGGDMQSLKLTSLNQFLTRLGESQLIINDEKNYWLSAIRMIDTFHSVVSDFQNGNQLNEEFLKEVANGIVDPNKVKTEKTTKGEDKYIKKADFINSSNKSRNYSDKSTNFSNRDTGAYPQKEARTNRDGQEFRNDRENRKPRYNKNDDDGELLDGLKNFNNTNERKSYGSQNRNNNDGNQSYKRNNDYDGKRQQYGEQRQSKYGEQRSQYGENRSKSYGDKPQYGERRQQSYGDSNYKQKQYGEQRQQYGQQKYGEQRQQYGEQKQQYGEQRQQKYGEQRKQYGEEKQQYGEQKQSGEQQQQQQQQQSREQKNLKYNTERVQDQGEVKERSTQVKEKSIENTQKQGESGRKVKRNMKFTIAQ